MYPYVCAALSVKRLYIAPLSDAQDASRLFSQLLPHPIIKGGASPLEFETIFLRACVPMAI